MRGIIVYESMFGSTRTIAEAIARGISDFAETSVVRASEVGGSVIYGADLVVVGGPTHGWSMSRPSTRKGIPDYANKPRRHLELEPGAAAAPGVREWLSSLGQHTTCAAAFDTRINAPAALTGRASKAISRGLTSHGMGMVAPPMSFLVDKNSNLLQGEVERAEAWGATIANTLRGRGGAAA